MARVWPRAQSKTWQAYVDHFEKRNGFRTRFITIVFKRQQVSFIVCVALGLCAITSSSPSLLPPSYFTSRASRPLFTIMSSTSSNIEFSDEAQQLWNAFKESITAAIADDEIRSTFERFSEFVQDSKTLKSAFQFLKASRCSLLPKPSPRTLLAALMVAHFPMEILEIDPEEMRLIREAQDTESNEADAEPAPAMNEELQLDLECMDAANAIVAVIKDESGSLRDGLVALNSFQEVFGRWKDHDRQRLLRELGNTHHQWAASLKHLEDSRENSRRQESVDVMIESVKRQIEANKRRILQLGGPEALEQILATPPVVLDLDELVREAGSKKYWDDFAAELQATPPNYERVVTLLSEVRDRIKALVPNRSDLQDRIHAGIDVDFIRQMIHFGSFDGEAFLNVFNTIWTHIKNFGAAADDEAWTQWRDSITEQATSGSTTWDVLLPQIFNKFLMQLDRIEEATRRFRERLNANQQQSEENPTVSTPSSS